MRPTLYFLAGLILAALLYLIANPNIELELTPVAGEPHDVQMTVHNRGVLPVLLAGWPAKRGPGFSENGWGGCGTGQIRRWLPPRSSCDTYLITHCWRPHRATEVGMHYMKVEEVYLPFVVRNLWETYEPRTAWAELTPVRAANVDQVFGNRTR